jgi:hypothetical protein
MRRVRDQGERSAQEPGANFDGGEPKREDKPERECATGPRWLAAV